jgi:hypothetical protein
MITCRELLQEVYDLLVETVKAHPSQKEFFVAHFSERWYSRWTLQDLEWRFQGCLGFGGKFWIRCYDPAHSLKVSCYPEDMTPVRKASIDETNKQLQTKFVPRLFLLLEEGRKQCLTAK